jgi:DNA-binding PucR family transcriptional regulator
MASRSVPGSEVSEAELAEALRDTAKRIERTLDDLSHRLADHLLREIPELGDDPELRAEWFASNRANISAWLGMVSQGTPAAEIRPPDDALQVARTYVIARLEAAAREVAVLYRDLGLLAILTSDVERAEQFVATELGPLAADDDTTLRLRATLRAYLEEGHSFTAAARRLGIHENTAKYRIRQCEELLSRTAGERSLKLEAALLLADTMSRRS